MQQRGKQKKFGSIYAEILKLAQRLPPPPQFVDKNYLARCMVQAALFISLLRKRRECVACEIKKHI
jgi:hypothetical protein